MLIQVIGPEGSTINITQDNAPNLLLNIVFRPRGLLLLPSGLAILGDQCSNISVHLWRCFVLKVGRDIILGWAWEL